MHQRHIHNLIHSAPPVVERAACAAESCGSRSIGKSRGRRRERACVPFARQTTPEPFAQGPVVAHRRIQAAGLE
jgi:hypothetical protein